VHCQDRRAGLVGRTIGRLARIPGLVYTLHGVADGLADLVPGNIRAAPRRRRDRVYYLSGERWLHMAAGGRVVVPSQALATFAIECVRLPPSAVDVVPNGIDVERFAPPPSRADTARTAVWLGLMSPVKRLDVLLDALAAVPALRLRLAGTGPEQAIIEQSVLARGLGGRVEILGGVADPVPILAMSNLFVLPSAAENCPLALLQAMACEVPVVASRVGGIPEIVRDGVEGLLVPPGDPAALAWALRRLLADPACALRMGQRARVRVCERFTLRQCVDGLLHTYERTLSCT
jgi:glycosyltransferase involved in cell wall biosynthesis